METCTLEYNVYKKNVKNRQIVFFLNKITLQTSISKSHAKGVKIAACHVPTSASKPNLFTRHFTKLATVVTACEIMEIIC